MLIAKEFFKLALFLETVSHGALRPDPIENPFTAVLFIYRRSFYNA
jgi:hypothetical protein